MLCDHQTTDNRPELTVTTERLGTGRPKLTVTTTGRGPLLASAPAGGRLALCDQNCGGDSDFWVDGPGLTGGENIQVSELRADTVKAKGGLAWLMTSENCKKRTAGRKKRCQLSKVSKPLETFNCSVLVLTQTCQEF